MVYIAGQNISEEDKIKGKNIVVPLEQLPLEEKDNMIQTMELGIVQCSSFVDSKIKKISNMEDSPEKDALFELATEFKTQLTNLKRSVAHLAFDKNQVTLQARKHASNKEIKRIREAGRIAMEEEKKKIKSERRSVIDSIPNAGPPILTLEKHEPTFNRGCRYLCGTEDKNTGEISYACDINYPIEHCSKNCPYATNVKAGRANPYQKK